MTNAALNLDHVNIQLAPRIKEEPETSTPVGVGIKQHPDAGLGGHRTGDGPSSYTEAPTTHTCGPTNRCPEIQEGAEVKAGSKPALNLSLGTSSPFFNKKEKPYKGEHSDSQNDRGIGEELTGSEANITINTKDYGFGDLICTHAKEFSQGFRLSDIFASLTNSDRQYDTLNKPSLSQKLNRMAKRGTLTKFKRGFWCHPDLEKAIRAAGPVDAGGLTGQNSNSSASSYPLPRLKDLLMKKPKVLPQPLSFKWALGMECLIRLNTGNVGIIGGSTDAGKTLLLLDATMRNMDNFLIRYINWEMDESELYERLLLLEKCYGVSADSFYEKVEFVSLYCDADDPASMAALLHHIHPDMVNIIDYLTVNEDFFKIGRVLEKIHNKLRKAVCLVALQKDLDAKLPYGKGQTQKVARLALTLDPAPDKGPDCTHLRFTKAKGRVNSNIKPTGVNIFFDIQEGTKLVFREASYLGKALSKSLTLEPGK